MVWELQLWYVQSRRGLLGVWFFAFLSANSSHSPTVLRPQCPVTCRRSCAADTTSMSESARVRLASYAHMVTLLARPRIDASETATSVRQVTLSQLQTIADALQEASDALAEVQREKTRNVGFTLTENGHLPATAKQETVQVPPIPPAASNVYTPGPPAPRIPSVSTPAPVPQQPTPASAAPPPPSMSAAPVPAAPVWTPMTQNTPRPAPPPASVAPAATAPPPQMAPALQHQPPPMSQPRPAQPTPTPAASQPSPASSKKWGPAVQVHWKGRWYPGHLARNDAQKAQVAVVFGPKGDDWSTWLPYGSDQVRTENGNSVWRGMG